MELADKCKECQRRHIKEINKEWKVKCKGIPKKLWEEGIYPVEEMMGKESYDLLTDDKKVDLQLSFNKLLWAEQKLGWTPYHPKRKEYQFWQKEIIMCSAKFKAGRLGRRMGKTEAICIEALHFADMTQIKNAHVMIIGPFQNLLEEIFDRMKLMLEGSGSVFRGRIKSTKKPFSITLPNGNKILGFTTGTKSGSEGASTRGQRCDRLFLDECDYMSQKDIETVMALMMEHSDFEITCTSTPQAMPGKFRDWCLVDPTFRDFHFPSTLMRSFKDQKAEIRRIYNKDGFAREILAEFYEDGAKVFATEDIRASFTDYTYANDIYTTPNGDRYITTLGLDWNSWKNGVQIIILGWNKDTQKLRVLHKKSVHRGDSDSQFSTHLQTEAIRQVMELSDKFNCSYVYVDKGYGAYQAEILEQHFFQIGQHDRFRAIDFGEAIKDINPYTGEVSSKRMKGVLVYSLQQQFEKRRIEMSPIEEGRIEDMDQAFENCLTYQLNNYGIEKFDGKDNPVFQHKGDHVLDALMLANWAFVEGVEKSTDFTPDLQMIGNPVLKPIVSDPLTPAGSIIRTGFMEKEEQISDIRKARHNFQSEESDEANYFMREEKATLFVENTKGGIFRKKRVRRQSIF